MSETEDMFCSSICRSCYLVWHLNFQPYLKGSLLGRTTQLQAVEVSWTRWDRKASIHGVCTYMQPMISAGRHGHWERDVVMLMHAGVSRGWPSRPAQLTVNWQQGLSLPIHRWGRETPLQYFKVTLSLTCGVGATCQ